MSAVFHHYRLHLLGNLLGLIWDRRGSLASLTLCLSKFSPVVFLLPPAFSKKLLIFVYKIFKIGVPGWSGAPGRLKKGAS